MSKKRRYDYIAQVRLSHAVTGAVTEKGQPHDVAHLTDAQLARLLANGTLVKLPRPFPKTTSAGEPAEET